MCPLRLLALLSGALLLGSTGPSRAAVTGGAARLDAWEQNRKMAASSSFRELPWQTLGPKFAGGRIESVDAPRGQPDTIYAGVGSGGVWKTTDGGRKSAWDARHRKSGVFRSTDAGETWKRTHEEYIPTYVGWDFCDIRVSPDKADEIYIGGFRLLVSRDGGKTFVRGGEEVTRLHPHRGEGMHLDMHDIWIDPERPDRVLLGNDGGLYVSEDRARTWLHLNNLPIAEFYKVHVDNETPFNIWGGTQDNASFVGPSTVRFQPGEHEAWEQVFLDPWSGGDGFRFLRIRDAGLWAELEADFQ